MFMSHGPEHIVAVTSAPNEMEAGVIIAALADQGIKATMDGAATAEFRVGVPGQVEILVAKEDLERAQMILREDEDNQDDVDWSQVDVGEPEQ
jgi:Putative prokaryotic signal transducing protein